MSRNLVVLVSVVFVIFYNLFLFHTQPGLGSGLLFLALNLYFLTVKNKDGKNYLFGFVSSLISIIFAFLFVFRDNDIVQIVNLLTAIFFSLTALYFYRFPELFKLETLRFLSLPAVTIKNSLLGVFNIFKKDTWATGQISKEITSSLFKGLFITIPIFLVLLLLLIQADPIFKKLTGDLMSNIGERVILSAIILIILLGVGFAKFLEKKYEFKEVKIELGRAYELLIILGSILLLFTGFITIQFQYLFSEVGERQLNQLGINSLTFSEYVNKGFFELLIASSISFLVLIYTFRYLHKLRSREKIFIQVLSGILTFETGLLLVSDVKRLILYASSHGLTRARIFGFIFLVWLSLILLIFLIRSFKEINKSWLFSITFLITILILLATNIINIDGLIATKYKPTVNNEVDYYYLTRLSADSQMIWQEAFDSSNKTILELEKKDHLTQEDSRKLHWAKRTVIELKQNIEYLIDKYGNIEEVLTWHQFDQEEWINSLRKEKKESNFPSKVAYQRNWQSLNLSEYLAYQEITKDLKYYMELHLTINRILKLENKFTEKRNQNIPIDRSINPPLIP